MPSATGTLEKIASIIAEGVQPLQSRLARENVIAYFTQLGAVFPDSLASDGDVGPALDAAASAAGAMGTSLTNLATAQQNGDTAGIISAGVQIIDQLATLFTSLDHVRDQISNKDGSWSPLTAAEVDSFTDGFALRIFTDSLLRVLETERPELVNVGVLLGVIDRFRASVVGASAPQQPVVVRQLQLGRLADALSNPTGYLKGLIGWGDGSFDIMKFLLRLQAFLDLISYGTTIDTSGSSPVLTAGLLTAKENTSTNRPGVDLTFHLAVPDGFSFTTPIRPGYDVTVSAQGSLPDGVTLTVTPPSELSLAAPTTTTITAQLSRKPFGSESAVVILGQTGASVLQANAINLAVGLTLATNAANTAATGEMFFKVGFDGAKAIVDLSEGDGFLTALTSGGRSEADFQLSASWSVANGFRFGGGGSLALRLPLNLDLGAFQFRSIYISFGFSSGKFPLEVSAEVNATLGPVGVAIDRVGVEVDLSFPSAPARGNLGPLQLDVAFKPPSGVGVSVDAGAVHGGGFLFIGDHQYAGVLELSVVSVVVKAFGLIQTQLPDGTPGFSFVIVIIAEFTPIQLGFGFTLLGVGGLLGVNRTIDQQALSDAVRTGSLEHLLFPDDPVDNAPAIIHDLATVFPAAKGHVIVGPMAKLGWGTPTLISADLGIIIEFPGPRLALLGVLRMLLPDPDAAILRLQMAVDGLLDFPAKKVSIDASLYDSTVAGFTVTADMAYRMDMGSNPSFLISIGGFNTGFQPPSPFPTLRRASVDLGISGNPSLVASGYFALTSNTAQIGASIQLHASGFGINLDGWLGFDVMFVFSPFSFTADISAGVRVSFHGVGFGINLHGSLSGPTPWHLSGRVCVSILWWDACLPVDITFGNNQPAALPEIDPWLGDQTIPVVGLQDAIGDARNWSGGGTPAEIGVVSLSAAATDEKTPIDPVGAATLRQKVAPLNRKLEKFGEYKPVKNDTFSLGPGVGSVTLNGAPVTELAVVEDDFAPGHFMNLTNDQKLSLPSYEPMDAGVSVAADRVGLGSAASVTMQYVTKFIDAAGTVHDNQPLHTLTQAQLVGLLKRSATALNGVRKTGTEKYMLAARTKNVQLGPRAFVVADSCSLVRNSAVTGTPVSQTQALLALRDHLATNPQDAGGLAVVPAYAERLAA